MGTIYDFGERGLGFGRFEGLDGFWGIDNVVLSGSKYSYVHNP